MKTSDTMTLARPGRNAWLATACAFLATALAPTGVAHSETYPDRPVRMLVGLPAGGGADTIARIFASKLGESQGQPVVVENRAGSGGLIAAEAAAKSKPDGYTLLFGSASYNAIFASLYKKLPYDPVKDFAPVSLIATFPLVLVVNSSVPAGSVGEFIAYAKRNPGKLSYASAGNGSPLHLSMEMLKSATGIDVVHVPYKGGVLAIGDLMSGQIQVILDALPTQLANIKAGKLRALAVTTAKRSAQLPGVPTMMEAGVPDFEFTGWFALFAPAGVPKAIIAKLNADAVRALNMPDLRDRMAQQGTDAASSTPEQLAAFQRAEIARWAKAVEQSGATAD
jgi:tripartite-type tricarboxylate transporter receptor subunit TctC